MVNFAKPIKNYTHRLAGSHTKKTAVLAVVLAAKK